MRNSEPIRVRRSMFSGGVRPVRRNNVRALQMGTNGARFISTTVERAEILLSQNASRLLFTVKVRHNLSVNHISRRGFSSFKALAKDSAGPSLRRNGLLDAFIARSHPSRRAFHFHGCVCANWTPEEDLMLEQSIEAKKTYSEAASLLNRTLNQVHKRLQVLRRTGRVSGKPLGTKWTPDEDLMLKQSIEAGRTYSEAARLLNGTYEQVRARLKVLRKTERISKKWTPDEDLTLKQGIQARKTYHEVAKLLNRTHHQVHARLAALRKRNADMLPPRPKSSFTEEDDVRLLEYHRTHPSWQNVEHYFPGRTRARIIARHYLLTSGGAIKSQRRQRWTMAEDAKLLHLKYSEGKTSRQMQADFPGRSSDALRGRLARLLPSYQARLDHKLWTAPDEAALQDGLERGQTYRQIAQHLGRSTESVASHVNHSPTKTGTRGSQKAHFLAEEIRRRHRTGMDTRHIAEELGISHDFVMRLLAVNVRFRRWSADETDALRSLVHAGESPVVIAWRLCRSVKAVYSAIKRLWLVPST